MTDQPPDPNDTTSYSPPAQARAPWAGEAGWSQSTPAHWLEPLPQHPAADAPASGRSGLPLVLVVIVALLAGALGSGLTYVGLEMGGRFNGPGLLSLASPSPPATPVAARTAPPARIDDASAVVAAAEAVSPAVVTITTTVGDTEDPFSLPETGVGSGVIYDSAGWILTNRHVVADATRVLIGLADGRRDIRGTVYGVDTLTDLAIVKIDEPDLPAPAVIGDSASLQPGQLAVAIGSPLGTLTNSVTSGVISALGRNVEVTDPVTRRLRQLRNLIQTDAAINPGNSGGALVDAAGLVVGINTAVASSAQGIGFAIPINIAKPIMRQAVAGQQLARPWIGVVYIAVDRNVQSEENLTIDYGALISPPQTGGPAIVPGSPADDAGLREGDILTDVDGVRIDDEHGLDDILSQYEPGDTVNLSLLRDGSVTHVSLTLGTRPADLE
jgi:2-alkenal reductase